MKFSVQILVATVAIAVIAMPAIASVKIATFRGTIFSGYDESGLFGIPGQDLSGLSYSTTYTYDRNLGTASTDGVSYDRSGGGTQFGSRSPIIDSSVTINGVTKHVSGAYGGAAQIFTLPLVEYYAQEYRNDGQTIYGAQLSNYLLGWGGYSLEANLAATTIRGPRGDLYFYRFDIQTNVYSINLQANFRGHDVTYSVSNVASDTVPEPASWIMLIVGFGLTGNFLRGKRFARRLDPRCGGRC